jgi:hypothetical protein
VSLFKRRRFPVEIILLCVRWYCKYGISYRDLAEMMSERGISVSPSTIFRWVQRYAPEIEKRVRPYRGPRSGSWRVDETYVRVDDWLTLYTSDSNFPGRDDITLRLNLNSSGHDRKITTNGTDGPTAGCVRGFFRVPYRYANPLQVSSDGPGLVGATQR